jgi:Cdc6-like AAA superfamily ATPase
LPRRRTITLYDKLFNLKQAIESEGTESPTELAWGLGIVIWSRERKIQYPLLTQLVEIDHIAADMAIRIRPREAEPRLELDPYYELENPGAPIFEKRARAVLQQAEETLSPFDPSSFEEILASAAATLDPQGKYWPRECEQSDAALPSASAELRVTDSWVLFARRKSTSFLVDDVRRLKEAVKSQSVFDGRPKVLVEDPTGPAIERRQFSYRGISSPGISSEGSLEIRNLYFPRPFNKEQVAIVEKLDQADGVVVQGPPGTGKTHTISNIICHYLALGKRVLVTSKGEPALAVLRDQIPSTVRPLTISLLTSEREGLKQLEHSVAKIATDISHLNRAEVREEIGQTETIIHKLHQKLADWARRNLSAVPENLGGLMLEELAHRVVAEHRYHSWFPDDLSGDAEFDPQFSEIDVNELRRARQNLGRDLQYLGQTFPLPTEVVDGPTLAVVHRDLQTLGQIANKICEKEIPPIRAPTTEMLLNAEQLLDYIQEAIRLNAACQADWLKQLRREFRRAVGGTPVTHVTKLLGLLTELATLEGTRVEFVATAVEVPDDAESDDELLSCARRASQGARPFGLIAIGKGELKRRFSSIRVNGSLPRDATHWSQVVQYLELLRGAKAITIRWNAFRAEFDGPVISETGTASIKSLSRVAEQIREAQWLAERFDPAIPVLVEEFFPGAFESVTITSDEREMKRLENALRLHLSRNRLSAAQSTLRAQKQRIKAYKGELFEAIRAFLDSLGCADVSEQSVQERWSTFMEELIRLWTQEPHFQTVLRVTSLIGRSGGSAWAQRLQERPATEEGDTEIPSHWRESWQWSRQKGYLRNLDGRLEIARLNGERRRAEHDLARANEHVVEQLTWLKLREALDQDRGLMAALQQYMAAIRSIGAGTGIRAIRFPRDARRAMEKANQDRELGRAVYRRG